MNKITEAVLRNKWLKLLSVALAVATWIYVSQKGTAVRTEEHVPVNFKVPSDTYLVQKQLDVRVDLSGPTPAMTQLKPGTLFAEIDVARKARIPKDFSGPLALSIEIEPSDIQNLPPNVTVTDLSPRSITIRLDQMTQKLMDVVIDENKDLVGKVRDGFRIHKIYPIPKVVLVRGPKSVLDGRVDIRPLPFPVGGLKSNWDPDLPLNTSDEATRLLDCLTPNPPKIKVLIEVVAIKEAGTVKDVPIEVRGLPGFTYNVLTLDKTKPFTRIPELQILGPKNLLEQPKLHAFVDLTQVANPRENPEVTAKVQFSAAPEVETVGDPPEVVVQIKAEKTE